MILSIIVPIYNVEKYILECVESINKYLIDDVEVICVNDGSKDASIEILENYISSLAEKKRKQFVLVNQENQGLSAARNTGIELAKGKYLAFLDSDDVLNNNFFEELIKIIKKYYPDIIEFSANRFDERKKSISSNYLLALKEDGLYECDEALLTEICNRSSWYAWKCIYRKELFSDIRYPVGFNFEDAQTTPYLYAKSKTIYFLNIELVGYRINQNSISNRFSIKDFCDLKASFLKLNKSLKDYPYMIGAVFSLARNYFLYFNRKNGIYATILEWNKIKKELKTDRNKILLNRYADKNSKKFFYYLGPFFILLLELKVKIQKVIKRG